MKANFIFIAIALTVFSGYNAQHASKLDNPSLLSRAEYPGVDVSRFPSYDPNRCATTTSSNLPSTISGSGVVYELRDGTYNNVDITVTNGAVLRAQNYRGVRFSGAVRVKVENNGVLDGIIFENAAPIAIGLVEPNQGRVTRCEFNGLHSPSGTSDRKRAIYGRGGYQIIDHNSFFDLCLSSLTVVVDEDGPSITYRNRFVKQCRDFGTEVWRVGGSSVSRKQSFAFVDENYFEDQNGEHELMSIKASNVVVRRNTLTNCVGSITNRYGSSITIQGNHITCAIKTEGGIRSFGRDQDIINNLVSNCEDSGQYGIALGLGDNCFGSQGGCDYEVGSNVELNGNFLLSGSSLVVGDNGGGNVCPTYASVFNNVFTGENRRGRSDRGELCVLPTNRNSNSFTFIRPTALNPDETGPFQRTSSQCGPCTGQCRNGQCAVSGSGFRCTTCDLGYRLANNGLSCELANVCDGQCANGVCVAGASTHMCVRCGPGFEVSPDGLSCDEVIPRDDGNDSDFGTDPSDNYYICGSPDVQTIRCFQSDTMGYLPNTPCCVEQDSCGTYASIQCQSVSCCERAENMEVGPTPSPEVPDVTEVPDMPEVPDRPDVPDVPGVPDMPIRMPDVPAVGSPSDVDTSGNYFTCGKELPYSKCNGRTYTWGRPCCRNSGRCGSYSKIKCTSTKCCPN
ncbi:hypothetical protein, variant [Sphaeroforma arctica JP610]|uniref:EGF-like domain-containing protein n=1 Tax=Sphaeroforma arctica JP610 TaxID=667725 RepID=A0A0L0GE43_9EUKA|nr:hypothetical protein, variant [Sphaeroforma arctica JP610]KNC87146.1 hypothetical protein, variant [Sphaeroforma arctica JP610]|eukprot:XP_014161049.1 hypothetical protein, variant [Sphaeroforma arctica JP610]